MSSIKLRFVWNSNLFIKRVLIALVLGSLCILTADILFNFYKIVEIGAIRRFFNITREDGVANFYSSFLLIANGFTLLLLYWFNKVAGARKSVVYGWLLLALFFTFMGFDDATKFHERVGTAAKTLLSGKSQEAPASNATTSNVTASNIASPPEDSEDPSIFDKFDSYPWQIVFGPFFAVMGLFILFFLWRNLPHQQSRYLFISALALYVVAVGLDYVEGFGNAPYEDLANLLKLRAGKVVHLAKAVEETFENLGHTFFLVCFLTHLMNQLKSVDGVELKPK